MNDENKTCCNEDAYLDDMDFWEDGADITAEVDEIAPYFEWTAMINWKFEEIALDDYEDKWVVLFFYPADFTFVCPTELEELADKYEELKKLWAEVVAVSTDTHFSHLAWHNTSPAIWKVKFPMLWDATWDTSIAYDVYQDHNGLAKRWTFIIDPDWILRSSEVSSEWLWRSADEIIRKIKALQHMRDNPWTACPLKWAEKWDLKPWEDLVWKI